MFEEYPQINYETSMELKFHIPGQSRNSTERRNKLVEKAEFNVGKSLHTEILHSLVLKNFLSFPRCFMSSFFKANRELRNRKDISNLTVKSAD